MGIGISILVGAIGAVLRYAVTVSSNQHGFNIHTGGLILMIVGGGGLLLSILFLCSFRPFAHRAVSTSRRDETITQDGHEQGRVVDETSDRVSR